DNTPRRAPYGLAPRIAALLDAAADKYKVPRPLARAIAWVESRGNPMAVSPAGARGVMQLMPATAKQLGVTDPHDPEQNIDAGVRYYAQLMARYGERSGLAAYNWGPGNVQKAAAKSTLDDGSAGWPGEVKQYVSDVLTRAEYELATMNTGRPAAAEAASSSEGSPTGVAPLSSHLEQQSTAAHSGSRNGGGEHDA